MKVSTLESPSSPVPTAPWWRPPGAWICALVSLLLTLFIAAPVLLHPNQRLFGTEIIGRYHDPFTVIAFFEHPTRPNLYTQPVTDYLGAAFAPWTGGVAAYNLVVLLSFPLAALFAYLLAFHLTGSKATSWLTALCFAFSPFHLAHTAYHPQVAQIQWLPLYFLALWLLMQRASPRRVLFFGLAVGLVALSNFYGGLIAAVLTPVELLGYWWLAPAGRRDGSGRRLVFVTAILGLLALAGWGYARTFAPQVLAHDHAFAFPLRDVQRYTARWWAYLVPPVTNPLLGAAARRLWDSRGVHGALVEEQLTLGWGLLILAAVAIGLRLRGHKEGGLSLVPWLGFFTASAFVCSLAPIWHVGPLSVPGPSALFYELAPMFRAHARFGVVVGLGVSMLAGLGLAALLRRRNWGSRSLAAGCLVLAAVELTPVPPWHWRDILPTAAHRWLVDHDVTGKTLDCVPAGDPAERSTRRFFGSGLLQLGPSGDCGESDLAAKLAARGVEHLIVRRATRVGAWFEARPMPPGLRLRKEFPSALLYDVDARPAKLEVAPQEGFFAREYYERRSYRWMGREAALRVINRTGSMRSASLRMQLNAFPEARRASVRGPGTATSFELRVGTQPEDQIVGPFEFPPGRSEVRIEVAGEATVADDVLHNGDGRALAVAVGPIELVSPATSSQPPAASSPTLPEPGARDPAPSQAAR